MFSIDLQLLFDHEQLNIPRMLSKITTLRILKSVVICHVSDKIIVDYNISNH